MNHKLTRRELWLMLEAYKVGMLQAEFPIGFDGWIEDPVDDVGHTVEMVLVHDAPDCPLQQENAELKAQVKELHEDNVYVHNEFILALAKLGRVKEWREGWTKPVAVKGKLCELDSILTDTAKPIAVVEANSYQAMISACQRAITAETKWPVTVIVMGVEHE